jgi:hypothetical protein
VLKTKAVRNRADLKICLLLKPSVMKHTTFCFLAGLMLAGYVHAQIFLPGNVENKIKPIKSFNSISGKTDLDIQFDESSYKTPQNIFIITLDGFRWQELFGGIDENLMKNEKFTPYSTLAKNLFWAETAEERRKRLMPFFWNVVGTNGQVYGNCRHNNKVNVANDYAKSYPGYNEMLTGTTDPHISSNKKIANPNPNVLEYINREPGFENKVVAFTSWDVFPYILNKERSNILINSGFDPLNYPDATEEEVLINKTENEGIDQESHTRYDELTFLVAKDYIKKNKPRVVYLGFGETDEYAHQERYDLYLEQANLIDHMIGELWRMVQTTPGYADNTIFLITTDHGRGKKKYWTSHGSMISGSGQIWYAVMGPGILPLGEIKKSSQQYQKQIAQTIAHMLGIPYLGDDPAGDWEKLSFQPKQ